VSVEIRFPVELFVEATPVSQQGSSRGKSEWKKLVADTVRLLLQPGYWATAETVHVTIFYFPASRMEGDVDNIVKPILDALDKIVYMSDRQVERVWVQKFEPGRPFSISNPTLCLAEALERESARHLRADR
jgi:crossover junction endodeoxyribonuclease RusA